MKTVIKTGLLVLFLALFFLNPNPVLAQHACPCTDNCSRSCSLPDCGGSCGSACSLGALSGLSYAGGGDYQVVLSWDAVTNANNYLVKIDANTYTTANTSYTFDGSAGTTHTWSITPKNWCYTGSAVSGPDFTIPPAPSGFTTSCGADGQSITIDWNDVSGATDYIVRIDAPPYHPESWVGPEDTWAFTGGPSNYTLTITPDTSYNYDIQTVGINGIRGGRAPFSSFACYQCYCTSSCYRICTNSDCVTGCNTTACQVGAVSGLTYEGTTTSNQVKLTWNAATNANNYLVKIDANTYTTSNTSYTFNGSAGTTHTWSVTPKNDCYTGTAVNGSNFTIPSAPTGLTGTCGINGQEITLTWNPVSGVSRYYLYVDSNPPISVSATNYTVSITPDVSHTYKVQSIGTNNILGGISSSYSKTCSANPPSAGDLTINSACTNSACNGKDIIVQYDLDHNQQIPFSATFSDPSGRTDITSASIVFDNDNSGDFYYRVTATNNAGSFSVAENGGTKAGSLSISGTSTGGTGNNLTVNFSLNVNALPAGEDFLSNIYLTVTDSADQTTGRVRRLGTGNFTSGEASYPYGTYSADALDLWNGKDVAVRNVGFYPVSDYADVCTQVSLPSSVTMDLAAIYDPSGSWLNPLNNWNTTTQYQPYYYYNSGNYKITYEPVAGALYILTAMSSEQFGGGCEEAVSGKITNTFKNGGVREEDGSVGDRTKKTAFSVVQVADGWSQIIDGNLFTNADFNLGIEPITCSTCALTDIINSTNNGLLLANGGITAKENVIYGTSNNWHAETQSGIVPFNNFSIGKTYQELKNMYTAGTYTELTGPLTIQPGGLEPVVNKTYFINGNLTVNDSTLLEVADNNYLLFVVNGNLTINSAVKDSLAGADGVAVEGMFVVLGNITVADDPADNDDDLTIEGALIASGTIDFQRSLYTNNNSRPPIKIISRPDMLGKMTADNIGIISLQKTLVSQY